MSDSFGDGAYSLLGSVIIVSHNGGPLVQDAVESIIGQTIGDRLEVIVVDNGSTDGSVEALEVWNSHRVSIVKLRENLGFAQGNNIGFAMAKGKYLLLLNNDAVSEARWAQELISAAEKYPDAGMCTSKILLDDNSGRIDNVGHKIFWDGLNRSHGHHEMDRGQYDQMEESLFASGCACLYRRDSVMVWGGFDPDFFAYGDDADLGLKIRLGGESCIYVPTAVVHHRNSTTLGRLSTRKIFLIERNRIWIMVKYLPVSWVLASPFFTIQRLFLSYLAARRWQGLAGELAGNVPLKQMIRTILEAWLAGLRGLPIVWLKRRKLWAKSRIRPVEFRRTLRRFTASAREMSFMN